MFSKIIFYLKYSLLVAILVFCALSYNINDTGENNDSIKLLLYSTTIILFILTFPNSKTFHQPIIFYWFISIILASLSASLIYAIYGVSSLYNEVQCLILPFILTLIGYNMKLPPNFIYTMCIVYGVSLIYAGYNQISYNIGGLIIEDQYIQTMAKNTYGASVSALITVLLLYVFNNKIQVWYKIIFIGIIFTLFTFILTLRARAAVVSLFCIVLLMLFVYIFQGKTRSILKYITICIVTLLISGIMFDISYDSFTDYVYNSLFQNREDDITSGRVDGYIKAINVITDNPAFGRLSGHYESIPWVHNYILVNVSNYGIVGSICLIALYVYILIFLIQRCFNIDIPIHNNTGYWAVMVLFIISMAEPTLPYTPGTAVAFAYISLGIYLNKTNINS